MDVKDMIAKVEAKIEDKTFQEALKKNPVKALEELLGVNLPDEQLKAVLAAVKAKLGSADLAGIVEGVEDKLGDVLSSAKEKSGSGNVSGIAKDAEEKIGDVLDGAKGLLGGLFGKKD